ncbi:DmsC/YnfH family molybdoenzyme membrane anchor subunit [Rehaibacterium terrae]|jgi:DMSO reductase anchor subunit|uniref:DMSO reductase anchor subunit n=1 Tax=Rehaibacterium terrae TaxID=1341696 RepID=A0A7W7XZZ6_9GAMM|nr:DmsC/YnfH family molybdoenzyme membrane anchor subunit [Rehaibacterium terrae]MBB5015403.1 DMSO reductase anchor subunit [Rehaibacterium terrae]
MRPALSVIFFTTLSGAGYGLLAWLGAHYAWRPLPLASSGALALLGFALALVTAGLLSSLLHLGQPQRAWRALTQWRSSWLSREGVLALLTYLPALALAALLWLDGYGWAMRLAGAALALASLATVACTAMIYASLRTIPAWSHPLVLPAYLGFALLTGGAWLWTALAWTGWSPRNGTLLLGLVVLVALVLIKLRYWHRLHRRALPADRASAIGLRGVGEVKVFEHPHTEANYITREMAFVLARKHARALRLLALALFAVAPLLLYALALAGVLPWMPALALLALAAMAGAFIERWLFFAEARHVVTLYY